MTDLVLTVAVAVPAGVLYLTQDPYSLHPDTRAQQAQSWRRKTVDNNWVEGSYTVSAVRENVSETVAVWVEGLPTRKEHAAAVDALKDAFGQLHYQMVFSVGSGPDADIEVWDCEAADFTVDSQQAYLHEQISLFKATVSRQPAIGRP